MEIIKSTLCETFITGYDLSSLPYLLTLSQINLRFITVCLCLYITRLFLHDVFKDLCLIRLE